MDLVPYMFWESQEPGSQLCAQHCLNNLLQQHIFDEFDLAEIAQRLDLDENAQLATDNQNKKSFNYDDTGFFSISVLERAMEVWGLSLVRWRGEAMKRYQEHPEEQAAFVLNLSSHWFALRRFAPQPFPVNSTRRWYNMNSFLTQGPEWISPTYLRLVLTQAEKEGYSVFVVRRASGNQLKEGEGWKDGGVGALPECEADRIAVALGEPSGRGKESTGPGPSKASSSRVPLTSTDPDQATVDSEPVTPPTGSASPPSRRRRRQDDLIDPTAEADPADPYAQTRPPKPPRNTARGSTSYNDAERDVLDDETGTFPEASSDPYPDEDAEDEVLDDDTYEDALDDDLRGARGGRRQEPVLDFSMQSRSYDDEDAALQAALKASMDDLPPGWEPPKEEPKPKIGQKKATPTATTPSTAVADNVNTGGVASGPVSGSQFKEELDDDDDGPAEVVSADEIRRRRLARFGQ